LLILTNNVFAYEGLSPSDAKLYESEKARMVKVYGSDPKVQFIEQTNITSYGKRIEVFQAINQKGDLLESFEVVKIVGSATHQGQESTLILTDGHIHIEGNTVGLEKEIGDYLSYKQFLLDQALTNVLERLKFMDAEGNTLTNISSPEKVQKNLFVVSADTEKLIQFYERNLNLTRSYDSTIRSYHGKKERESLQQYARDVRKNHKRLTDAIRETQRVISEGDNKIIAFGEKLNAEETLRQKAELQAKIKVGRAFYSGTIKLTKEEKTNLIKKTLREIQFGLSKEGAALVSQMFAYLDSSEIPLEVYKYVDVAGVLKGEYLQAGQFIPLGEGTEIENSLMVANELQVAVDELLNFEKQEVDQHKAFMALATLNLANLEFGAGTEAGTEKGYEYLKLAKSLVKELGSFGAGIGNSFYDEIKDTLSTVADIGVLSYQGYRAMVNDPEGSAKIAEGVFLYLLENYESLGEKALLGTGKLLESELEKRKDQLYSAEGVGEITGDLLVVVGTLGIGKAVKAGATGTKSALKLVKQIIAKIPKSKLDSHIVQLSRLSYKSRSFVDNAQRIARGTKVIPTYSEHMLERMSERSLSKGIVEKVIQRGKKYWNPDNKTYNYVLRNGANGKDILVAVKKNGERTTIMSRDPKKLKSTIKKLVSLED
jgi:tellurite resistance protein